MKTRKHKLLQQILFVTAFKNIHRDKWTNSSRSIETYINHFMILTKLPYTLIVYVEPEIKKILPPLPNNIILKDFNKVHTFFDLLNKDKKIMKSKTYQSKIPQSRKNIPEHLYSEYNFINHSKINFIAHTKKLYPQYAFYSWVDFGFAGLNIIPNAIKVSTLPKKVIYQSMKKPISISAEEMLSKNDVYIAGSAFIIYHDKVEVFESNYRQKIIEWQKNYITDDDQNLVLQLYLDDPSLFHLVYHKNWRMLYSMLQ
jgi:hypothetical protein